MFLGIDIGTSSVKLSLADARGDEVASAEAPLSVQTPHPYWSEQDPEAWWQALIGAMARLGQTQALEQITALGLSGQMHGAVLLDGARRVIRPAILWNDGRSFEECSLLAERVPEIGHLAGVPPLPGFTAPKLLWLARNEPEAHARVRHVLLPKDYVAMRLHGRLVTDPSDAAGTLWFDQAERRWSARLAEASATGMDWLPECLDGTEIAGALRAEAAAALGLRPGLPIAAGAGDAAAGAVGVGAVRDGRAFLSLGTSGQLFVACATHRPNPGAVVHAYAHTVPDLWFQMAAMLNGARPMQWFADLCGCDVPVLLAEAAQIRAEDAPLFLPYLTGERSPHGDPHIRGSFAGLGDATGRAEMMRGVVNAIAFSFADAADSLYEAGTTLRGVSAIGGGSRSDLLLQTLADVLGLPLGRQAGSATGPALGAARLAGVAAGAMTLDDLAREPEIERVFAPRPGHGLRDALTAYRELYQRLKGMQIR